MNPDITVVTCIYNKGDRTERTMQSILAQTYLHWRYIVINDGSTDNTREILSKYDDPRIEIRHQLNRGFCASMVDIMREVTTPFVAIQGAGDISSNERMRLQRDYLINNPETGAVGCNLATQDCCGRTINNDNNSLLVLTKPAQLYHKGIFSHGEVMMNVKAYRLAGGYRKFFFYAQDRDLWLRMLRYSKLVRLNQSLYTKVVSIKTDISGDPKKLLTQKQLSTFAVSLSQSGIDNPPIENESVLQELFDKFVKGASRAVRVQWVHRIGSIFRGLTCPNTVIYSNLQTAAALARQYAMISPSSADLHIRLLLLKTCTPAYGWYAKLVKLASVKARGKSGRGRLTTLCFLMV
jgi:hypothetical protein